MTEAPDSKATSYYGQPILKETVWKPAVPVYFFAGGLAGASSTLALAARARGNSALARRATFISLAGFVVSPVLLIIDLGRPARFYNMLRVFKLSSPMSVGSWLLSAAGGAAFVTALLEVLHVSPRLKAGTQTVAGILGLPMTTYTAALLSDTAVPVWHEARGQLPFVFGSSAAMSAGAASMLLTPSDSSTPARRLAVAGAVGESVSTAIMLHRLGDLVGEPYRIGRVARLSMLSRAFVIGGSALGLVSARNRATSAAGASLMLAGSLLQRLAIFEAGKLSARDPKYTVLPQRTRLAEEAAADMPPSKVSTHRG